MVHCLVPIDAGAGGARAQGDSAGTHLPPAGRAGGGARANDPGASIRAEENSEARGEVFERFQRNGQLLVGST